MTAIVLSSLAIFAGAADAQRKPKRSTPARKVTVIPPLDVRAAREKVDNQRANVTLFIDKLGPIAQGLETLDQSAKTNRLPPETIAQNDANKQKVIAAIRNLRTGLSVLESEFRTKPSLAKYLPSIQGITDLAALSEDSALAGKFVAAKDPLRAVSAKLTDTLAVLPH
jgi:hypothetical protein